MDQKIQRLDVLNAGPILIQDRGKKNSNGSVALDEGRRGLIEAVKDSVGSFN